MRKEEDEWGEREQRRSYANQTGHEARGRTAKTGNKSAGFLEKTGEPLLEDNAKIGRGGRLESPRVR